LQPAQLGAAIGTDARNTLAALKAIGPKTRAAWFKLVDKIRDDVVEYVAPRGAARALTQAEQRAVRKIDNTIRDHLKPHDYTGTLRDMVGNPVPRPRGGFYKHAEEMNDSLRGLRKHAETLKNATDPAAVAARQRALDAIKKIEEFTKGAGL